MIAKEHDDILRVCKYCGHFVKGAQGCDKHNISIYKVDKCSKVQASRKDDRFIYAMARGYK